MTISIGEMGFCKLPFTPEVEIPDLFLLPMFDMPDPIAYLGRVSAVLGAV